jgi:hypothetical protein
VAVACRSEERGWVLRDRCRLSSRVVQCASDAPHELCACMLCCVQVMQSVRRAPSLRLSHNQTIVRPFLRAWGRHTPCPHTLVKHLVTWLAMWRMPSNTCTKARSFEPMHV